MSPDTTMITAGHEAVGASTMLNRTNKLDKGTSSMFHHGHSYVYGNGTLFIRDPASQMFHHDHDYSYDNSYGYDNG